MGSSSYQPLMIFYSTKKKKKKSARQEAALGIKGPAIGHLPGLQLDSIPWRINAAQAKCLH